MPLAHQILALREARNQWPVEVEPTADHGIVISGCARLFLPLWANLLTIREQGWTTEIDVWHLPGEFNEKQSARMRELATVVECPGSPFTGLSGTHGVFGFKAWMLACCRFRKALMLDVNSFPLQPLEPIFDSGKSCILWQDGPWKTYHERIAALRQSLALPIHPFEFESGQVFVVRSNPSVRAALRLAAALNTIGMSLYKTIYGDKETYALAFDLLREPYSVAPAPVVHPPGSESYYGGLIQPWLDGSQMFYHPMALKKKWWKFRPEWESLYRKCHGVLMEVE